eukprot:scaffold1877_cov67-Phaeocystis_antarctica.AAC.17
MHVHGVGGESGEGGEGGESGFELEGGEGGEGGESGEDVDPQAQQLSSGWLYPAPSVHSISGQAPWPWPQHQPRLTYSAQSCPACPLDQFGVSMHVTGVKGGEGCEGCEGGEGCEGEGDAVARSTGSHCGGQAPPRTEERAFELR